MLRRTEQLISERCKTFRSTKAPSPLNFYLIRGMGFETRLQEKELTSLETRREKINLIQIHKIIKGLKVVGELI